VFPVEEAVIFSILYQPEICANNKTFMVAPLMLRRSDPFESPAILFFFITQAFSNCFLPFPRTRPLAPATLLVGFVTYLA